VDDLLALPLDLEGLDGLGIGGGGGDGDDLEVSASTVESIEEMLSFDADSLLEGLGDSGDKGGAAEGVSGLCGAICKHAPITIRMHTLIKVIEHRWVMRVRVARPVLGARDASWHHWSSLTS
jgi:hypothetical protein